MAGLAFAGSAAATVYFCSTMSGGMEMSGGWTMSMAWMGMPGLTPVIAALSFLGMWLAMMTAMMLPSACPMFLNHYRAHKQQGHPRAGCYAGLMGGAYFLAWVGAGGLVCITGTSLAAAAMSWAPLGRAIPLLAAAAIFFAGAFQCTSLKRACLQRCRDSVRCVMTTGSASTQSVKLGLRCGAYCVICCSGLMLIQLALGIMNLALMAILASIIALEKLAPRPEPFVKLSGLTAMIAGLIMIAIRF